MRHGHGEECEESEQRGKAAPSNVGEKMALRRDGIAGRMVMNVRDGETLERDWAMWNRTKSRSKQTTGSDRGVQVIRGQLRTQWFDYPFADRHGEKQMAARREFLVEWRQWITAAMDAVVDGRLARLGDARVSVEDTGYGYGFNSAVAILGGTSVKRMLGQMLREFGGLTEKQVRHETSVRLGRTLGGAWDQLPSWSDRETDERRRTIVAGADSSIDPAERRGTMVGRPDRRPREALSRVTGSSTAQRRGETETELNAERHQDERRELLRWYRARGLGQAVASLEEDSEGDLPDGGVIAEEDEIIFESGGDQPDGGVIVNT